jgi:hypothetical protein
MGRAVAEAYRVLRPGGLLLDIHPLPSPLQLELWLQSGAARTGAAPDPADSRRRPLGQFEPDETLGDFAAAGEALQAAARRPGLGFVPAGSAHFEYRYFFDDLDELTDYLEENDELELASEALLQRALQALQSATAPARLVLIQPVVVTCLRKP